MNSCEKNFPKRACDSTAPQTSGAALPSDSVPSLAMAYIPNQTWGELYELCTGFQKGTIFQSLDFPFYGGKLRCGSCACNRR